VRDRPVLLYDADCRFCRFVARVLLRLDRRRRLAFATLQDEAAPALLPGLSARERLASIHVVEPDGELRSAGDALVRLVRQLGLPAPRLLARVYAPISRRRRVLGKFVPDGPAPVRFP
jgi:predicted DCC family thiol-disulfide oxidoreductase YuxK